MKIHENKKECSQCVWFKYPNGDSGVCVLKAQPVQEYYKCEYFRDELK